MEFDEACKAYRRQEAAAYRDGWERMRVLASIVVQPHVRRKFTARELLPLPWDDEDRVKAGRAQKPLTAAERKARLEELLKRVSGGGDGEDR